MSKPDYFNFSIIILAAGQGKRMKNPNMSKVMALLDDSPLIAHVLNQAVKLHPDKIVVIVGYQKDTVINYVRENFQLIEFAIQDEQLGTGHAVLQTEPNYINYDGDILILSGDVPLLRSATLDNFIKQHYENNPDLSVLSTYADNPKGYGRIIRNEKNEFVKIVEEKDANSDEQLIKEINSGVYFVNSKLLFDALKQVSNNNQQNEYYLTDIIEILQNNGYKVNAFAGAEFNELQGVNSPEDLANVHHYYNELK